MRQDSPNIQVQPCLRVLSSRPRPSQQHGRRRGRSPMRCRRLVRPMTRRCQRSLTQQFDTAKVKVQPRCGGHSFADYSIGGQDGSLVVDLKQLQKYEVDNSTWIAKVGGGTLLGELTKRMHDNGGRAMSHGTCPQARAFGRPERFTADGIVFDYAGRDWWPRHNGRVRSDIAAVRHRPGPCR